MLYVKIQVARVTGPHFAFEQTNRIDSLLRQLKKRLLALLIRSEVS
jgi:hypothetical protein